MFIFLYLDFNWGLFQILDIAHRLFCASGVAIVSLQAFKKFVTIVLNNNLTQKMFKLTVSIFSQVPADFAVFIALTVVFVSGYQQDIKKGKMWSNILKFTLFST